MRRSVRAALAAVLFCSALVAASLPAGKQVRVRLGQTISSATAHAGDSWEGTLASALVVNGKTVAPKGAPVKGKVADAKASGRLTDPGFVRLRLTSIRINGADTPVRTGLVSRKGASHKGRNAKAIGGTAAAGAVIGAIAGGGKGAAIGAGAGAAAGTAGAAATGKKDVQFRVESVVTFTVR